MLFLPEHPDEALERREANNHEKFFSISTFSWLKMRTLFIKEKWKRRESSVFKVRAREE